MKYDEKHKQSLKLAFIGMKGLPPDLPGAGGGERETDAKTRRLAERGHNVTVYCRRNYVRKPENPYHGIKLISLPSISRPGLEMLSHTFLATLHAILFGDADIVSYHGMGNALYLPLLKLGRKRTVVYMDGVDWDRPKWGKVARLLLKWGATAAFRWADIVYVDNAISQQKFAYIFGRSPQLITLAADIWAPPGDDLVRSLGLNPEEYILFVGMLRPDKGVHLLIKAYSTLETDVPLVIVGDNPDNPAYVSNLKELADSRVRFLGYQYGKAAKQLFANCLLYVQPSLMEGNSPALMSAMACGRCVVVNGIEQNKETIGSAGLAFAPSDTEDLRLKLSSLLADHSHIRMLGEKAQRRIRDDYDWELVVDKLERQYFDLSQ